MRNILLIFVLCAGCGLIDNNPQPTIAMPQPLNDMQITPSDSIDDAKTKKELIEIAVEAEKTKADTANEIYVGQQEIYDREKTRQVELAAMDEQLKAVKYDANKWLWAVLVGAISCVCYAYKRLNLAAALLGLAGFGCLFALIIAGQRWPGLVALSPVPFIALLTYVAWRDGLISDALRACVRGIEIANDRATKQEVARQDHGKGAVERTSRKEIDKLKK